MPRCIHGRTRIIREKLYDGPVTEAVISHTVTHVDPWGLYWDRLIVDAAEPGSRCSENSGWVHLERDASAERIKQP